MRYILIVIIVLLLAAPVWANPNTHVEATHEVELHLDGDWNYESSVVMPSVTSETKLEGVGEAYMKSTLAIYEKVNYKPVWFDLF